MILHRFFISPTSVKGKNISFPEDISKQIKKVLRLKPSDKVIVLDNSGNEYLVKLEQMATNNIIGSIISTLTNNSEPDVKVTLYQALTTKDKFESILQKGTEIGISRFVPIETKRSLLKVKDLKQNKIERFEKIIREAAEQSERVKIPELSPPMTYEEALQIALKSGLTLIAWENERKFFSSEKKISEILKVLPGHRKIAIFIGPEGGFEESEIEYAKDKKVITVGLGPRVLRTETASLVFSSLIFFVLGELDKKVIQVKKNLI